MDFLKLQNSVFLKVSNCNLHFSMKRKHAHSEAASVEKSQAKRESPS
jgi:hypothetical protein